MYRVIDETSSTNTKINKHVVRPYASMIKIIPGKNAYQRSEVKASD